MNDFVVDLVGLLGYESGSGLEVQSAEVLDSGEARMRCGSGDLFSGNYCWIQVGLG